MPRTPVMMMIVVAAWATGACRKEDQNRPTSFKPGVYLGEAMPTLTKEQVADLAKRGQLLK